MNIDVYDMCNFETSTNEYRQRYIGIKSHHPGGARFAKLWGFVTSPILHSPLLNPKLNQFCTSLMGCLYQCMGCTDPQDLLDRATPAHNTKSIN
jgi:hypothetical protein